MRDSIIKLVTLTLLCIIKCGCGIGYNRMLFMTKTNVGLDVDSKPPTAELSVARREGIIEPSYEAGKTPPAAASFRFEGNWFDPRISSAFSGGKAALLMSALLNSDTSTPPKRLKSKLCLKAPLKTPALQRFFSKIPILGSLTEEGDEVRPFFFATDTGYGLKVAWSGSSGSVPDTVKLGYNRKEFAYAPVFVVTPTSAPTIPAPAPASPAPAAEEPEDQPCGPGETPMEIVSFIATIDNSAKLAAMNGSDLRYVQFFATGEAANNLVLHPEVREVLGKQIVPAYQAVAYTRQKDQIALFNAIKDKYNALGDADKQAIRAKAIQLELVPASISPATFVPKLSDAVDMSKPEVTSKLQELKAASDAL
ncbi:MAG: hypothetical protein ACHQ9S_26265 [Candidatus Binatia bacterium]